MWRPSSFKRHVCLSSATSAVPYDNAIDAIRDVSIAVPEGGIVALLGSNGAGKSTLLKTSSRLVRFAESLKNERPLCADSVEKVLFG